MSDQSNNQTRNQQGEQVAQNTTEPPDNNLLDRDLPESPGNEESFGRYSYLGPHGEYADDEANTDPDNYGPQDQFGDLDNQDPYSNLDDQDPDSTPDSADSQDPYSNLDDQDPNSMTGSSDSNADDAGLYGLAEPLAQPGDQSQQGSDKDRYGTRGSQDQYGYQK